MLGQTHHHELPVVLIRFFFFFHSFMQVAGVSINGGHRVSITQCTIGPSRKDIPVTGLFSTGHFIRPYVSLRHSLLCFTPT